MNTRPFIAAGILLVVLGCRDDTQLPMESPPTPPAAIAAASPLAFLQVSAGEFFTCGVSTDSRSYCWGANDLGELGIGTLWQPEFCQETTTCSTLPIAVVGGLRFKQVSADDFHACGITTDNRAYCWGSGNHGELGDGTLDDHQSPVAVEGGLYFKQVTARGGHSCGVTTDDRAYCWGDNGQGKLGDGTTTDRPSPVAVAGRRHFLQLSAGYNHTCGITTVGRALCWGGTWDGALGTRSPRPIRLKPARVHTPRRFSQIDAGFDYTCGVTTEHRAYCWGRNSNGELGDGTTTPHRWPLAVVEALSFKLVSANLHTCGLTTGNRAYCWGQNWNGQLGDGTTTQRLSPVAVAGERYFEQVSAGGEHTCGKTPAGAVYCWGDNSAGQVGNGTRGASVLVPAAVLGPAIATQ